MTAMSPSVRSLARISRLPRQRYMAGLLLLETTLALLLISIATAYGFQKQFKEMRDSYARFQGQALKTIQGAANAYLTNYYKELTEMATPGSPITATVGTTNVTINNGNEPTIDNLVDLGLLPSGYSNKAIVGGNYRIRISQVDPCAPPNCNLEGHVWIDTPYREQGSVDYVRLGIAAKAIGSDGAYSRFDAPDVIRGLSGQWSALNPQGAVAGILVARTGYASSSFTEFYRRDASLPAAMFTSTVQTVGQPCPTEAAIASGSGEGLVLVCSNGTWKIYTGRTGTAGAACSPEGQTATAATTGEALVCRSGVYVRLQNLLARNVEVSRQLVRDGDTVTKPTCDAGGTADYSFHMNRISTDLAVAPPLQSTYIAASDNGGSWSVQLRLRSDTGSEESGNVQPVPLTAVMKLECRY